uniref:Uncharacterized protein n=2 Tax=Lotharella globosa TaxID=91324 RepID=A0A7S3YXL6_9EUKA
MQRDMYDRDPILRPDSRDPKQSKTVVRENLDKLYGTDPILNPPSDFSGRIYSPNGPHVSKRTSLMPTNNGRNPITEGDYTQRKPSKKQVPEYAERRENKWAPRPLCRAPRRPADPDCAGAKSTDLGKRQGWTTHFQKFKPARQVNPHNKPQDGKFKEFRPSRAFGPTSHVLQKTSPILQNDGQYEAHERSQVRTFKDALRRSVNCRLTRVVE